MPDRSIARQAMPMLDREFQRQLRWRLVLVAACCVIALLLFVNGTAAPVA